jgi:tetratricopeptide (TPR) repeat protein
VNELPIDYFALYEQYEIKRALSQKDPAILGELWRLLAREPDSVLELAFDYLAIGRDQEARGILEEAINRTARYPMLHYTLGYLYESKGDAARAREQFALGSKGDSAFVFPHRVEEIDVLQTALKANPRDGRAAYYLGNVLASKNRDEEALAAWTSAATLDPENTIAHRNLGRALWVVAGKKEEAAKQYQQAIASAPNEYRLYIEFDRLLSEMGATDQRLRLLENAPPVVKAQSGVVQSLAAAYIDAGRFADASALLEKTMFTSGEGEDAALALYRRAHLGLARNYQRSGDHLKAAMEFVVTTEFPRNFGVGRPAMQSQAREYVAAAREYEAIGRHDEAEQWWQRAATEELNPPTQPEEPWSEHYFYKAVALEHVGRKPQARALYERLARLNNEQQMIEAEPWPPSGAIRFVLAGVALKALGRKDEARSALERALKLDPQNELARVQLDDLNGNARVGSR